MKRKKTAIPPRGLWIPTVIMLLPNITALDTMLMSRVAAFGKNPCTLSNASFAQVCHCTARHVQRRIRYLLDIGYLLNVGADKWHRKLWVPKSKLEQIVSGKAA